MKKTTLIKTMLLLCTLVVGSSSMWAQFVAEKVTAVSGLVAGEKYLIVCTSQNTAMGAINTATANKHWYAHVTISITDGVITAPVPSTAVLTLGGETDAWTLKSNLSGDYLSLTKYDNYLFGSSTATTNSQKWKIAFDDSGNATIQNVAYPQKKATDETVRRIEYNKSSGSERFACYASTQQAVQLYHITGYQAKISTAEYATFYSPLVTDFSTTGITVYTAEDKATSVALNEVTSGKVPANTPVVLYKAEANGTPINVPVIASAEAVGDNNLVVSDGTTAMSNAYVLANKSKGVGFYRWTGATLSAGKIYLQAQASYAREFLGFNDDVTAIEAVKAQNVAKGEYFNLAGQRVAQPTKGLYIVNGKKFLIK